MAHCGKGSDNNSLPEMSALLFLQTVGDEELIKFLRFLPMVSGDDEDKLSLSDLIYEMKLWPFVKEAWGKIDGEPGVAGRISQLVRVYDHAENELYNLTGEKRRKKRKIDLAAFVDVYARHGLP